MTANKQTSWMLEDAGFAAAYDAAKPFTMTSLERCFALWRAVEHISRDERPGNFVECGCWRGGSAIVMALAAQAFGLEDRNIFLFDTFAGMTEPGDQDVDVYGAKAADLLEAEKDNRAHSAMWAAASLEDVKANIQAAGLSLDRFTFVEGDVRQTCAKAKTSAIALLRLDTDFFDSTLAEFEALYPRLVEGGVLIIDDYGHWAGARAATEAYFDAMPNQARRPMLSAVDYTGHVGIKPPAPPPPVQNRYDYAPPGLVDPELLPAFPSLMISDPNPVGWPWLRKNTPHIWRTDQRSKKKQIGVLSYEEAVLLHNLAKPFAGEPALEIGCHFAWSTAQLLAAGVDLDVIDPGLADQDQSSAIAESLENVHARVPGCLPARLYAGFSPNLVEPVQTLRAAKWAFAFIDGWHDGDGPTLDAKAVMPHLAARSMVVFHDLLCPAVLAGLKCFEAEGWQSRTFNTTQMMGVAWRGDVVLPKYQPDPNMPQTQHHHLSDRGV